MPVAAKTPMMRRSLAGALAISLAVLAMAPVAARGNAAAAGPRAEMRRVTIISGTRSGYVPVKLPVPARVDARVRTASRPGPNPNVRVSGEGLFTGILLLQDPPDPRSDLETLFLAGRFRKCADGCGVLNDVDAPLQREGTLRLPAGNYRLYLLTDGHKARVALTLTGLSGTARVTPTVHTSFDVKAPQMSVSPTPAGFHYSWGAHYRKAAGRGIALGAYWGRTNAYTGRLDGVCSYRGSAPFDDSLSYSSMCSPYTTVRDETGPSPAGPPLPPAGFSQNGILPPAPENVGKPLAFESTTFNFTGPWTHWAYGTWFETGGLVTEAGSSAFFMSLD